MSSKIIIRCEEANHVCDKTQYNEGTLWEKIKLNIHLLFCKACRKYTKSNVKLTKLFKHKTVSLDATSKENLQAAFNKELAKHQQ